MQNTNIPNEAYPLHNNEDHLSPSPAPEEPQNPAPAVSSPAETLKSVPPVIETPAPVTRSDAYAQSRTLLPQRRLSYAVTAGAIAGVLAALITIVIISVNAGTFHAASLQIAADRLTVKTALALAAWEILTFVLSLLVAVCLGLIMGRIVVRRRLGFLAGALAGAIFDLILFLASLIPAYAGNLTVTTITTGSLVISFLVLCLWSLGGGLVSLFGTWIMTVRHPHYLSLRK